LIKLTRNFGQQKTIAAGLEHANGDIVVIIDNDMQYRPEDIPILLKDLK
jgi:dolichol-phosphate mannosyltransferase